MQCVHNDRIPRADQQNLAVEQFGDEDSQNVPRLDTVVRHAEHDEIGQLMDGFNGMLHQLGEQDAALREIHSNLRPEALFRRKGF